MTIRGWQTFVIVFVARDRKLTSLRRYPLSSLSLKAIELAMQR